MTFFYLGDESAISLNNLTVTITGASGFLGTRLQKACEDSNLSYRSVDLRTQSLPDPVVDGEILVHLAAVAHAASRDERTIISVNRELAITTGHHARERGYRQLVFLSSALVWGSNYEIVTPNTPEKPDTLYGRCKLQAERGLRDLETSQFAVTVLRPPLVYGPGVKGNLLRLLHAVHRWPVCPLGVSDNLRTLVHVDNVCALILHLARTETSGVICAVDETPALSSKELLERIAQRIPRPARITGMPQLFQSALLHLLPDTARRLLGSFVVQDTTARDAGFIAPYSVDHGFDAMVSHYLKFTPMWE